jgi:arginine exporter protein ArgO
VDDVLLSGLVTGYAIAVPVGAVAALIVALSSRSGWRIGAAAGLGVATTDGLYALVAVVAGKGVATVLAPLKHTLQVVSVVALLAIAALTFAHAVRPTGGREASSGRPWTPARAWLSFVGITAVNPATVVYFAAVVLGGTVTIHGAAQGAAFVGAAFVASASWQVLVATLGAGLGAWISGPRGRRTTGVVAAVVIAVLAVRPLF